MALFDTDDGLFSRRQLILAAAQGGLFAILAGRLHYLQVSQSETYSTLAEANRVNINELSSARGRIRDRFGHVLADNDQRFQIVIVPEQAGDLEMTLASLQGVLALSDRKMRELRRRISRSPKFKPLVAVDDLTWEDFSKFNLNIPFLPGIEAKEADKRIYPHKEASAHLVGYVGTKTAEDLRRIGNIVGDVVGRSGVEREYEEALRGEPGVRHVEVNAYGRTIRELRTRPGEAGDDLHLAICADLQNFLTQRMQGHSGSAIIMDVETGELLSLVSTPGFDPNEFSRGITARKWEEMLAHDKKPLMNKALRGQYAPGSTFKMLVALAALEAKLIKPDEKISCSGIYEFGGETFHCWARGGHGPTDMVQAIEKSCDTYFYDLALRVGIDRIEEMAKRFGFGRATGIDLYGEKTGIVPGRDWKRANYDVGWRPGETVITGIGQGYFLATPMQMTVMTAALANGGRLLTPRVTKQDGPAEGEQIDIDQEALSVIRRGLYAAVNKPDGTAYASSLLINQQRMSGKTGTVQVRRISMDERETGVIPNSELDWHLRDHSLFVGYVPHNKPRFAVTVVVEHGGGGAYVAAPIARDAMVHLLQSGRFDMAPQATSDIRPASDRQKDEKKAPGGETL